MGTFRCDNHVPEHILAPCTSGVTLQGTFVELFGALGVNITVLLTNGAAGTFYVDGSNQLGASSTYQNIYSQTLSANQTALFAYSLVDQITSMHKLRCRFVPTANGNIACSVNARRMTY